MSERAAEQPLSREAEATDTVTCGREVCEREVFEAATVDVVAGAVIGEWDDPEHHVGVTGTGSPEPEVEQWCLSCATERFGIKDSAHGVRSETVRRYITASNLASFFLGVTLVSLFVLMV